jgi:hypothetical protein
MAKHKHKKTYSYSQIKNPTDDLTEDQQVALADFQKRFSNLKDKDKEFCDLGCFIRYLIARDWDLDKSEQMLLDTLAWRKDFKPEEITVKDIEEEATSGKMYINGLDRNGRPIIIMRPDRENTTNYANQLKYLVYTLESAIKMMPDGASQLVWVIAFQNFSMSNAPPISQCMETLKILSNHYPERLGIAYLMDTPWIFGFFWRGISSFLNQKTANKVVMITSSTHKDEKEKLLKKTFDLKTFEKDLGGESDYNYDSKKYFDLIESKMERLKL